MMSTFSGLLVGVVTAAAITVFYGDELQRKVRDLVQLDLAGLGREAGSMVEELASASVARVTDEPVVEVSARDVETAATTDAPERRIEATVGTSVSAPEPEPAPESLEQRWAAFAAASGSLTPAGEFPHRSCFTRAAAATGVPETLLLAVARGESAFNSAARSDKDAIGLMQIRWPVTSHHLGVRREADLYDPCTNVDAGARYIVELSQRYNGDLHRVMGAYNYGPGRIDAGPMPEGARWYSQYIYQHLQRVLGQPHVASSELLAGHPAVAGGYQVLMAFNRNYRAREFLQYLQGQAPGLELAQRSERVGLHEVVLLYTTQEDLQLGLQMLSATGLVALDGVTNTVKSL